MTDRIDPYTVNTHGGLLVSYRNLTMLQRGALFEGAAQGGQIQRLSSNLGGSHKVWKDIPVDTVLNPMNYYRMKPPVAVPVAEEPELTVGELARELQTTANRLRNKVAAELLAYKDRTDARQFNSYLTTVVRSNSGQLGGHAHSTANLVQDIHRNEALNLLYEALDDLG